MEQAQFRLPKVIEQQDALLAQLKALRDSGVKAICTSRAGKVKLEKLLADSGKLIADVEFNL